MSYGPTHVGGEPEGCSCREGVSTRDYQYGEGVSTRDHQYVEGVSTRDHQYVEGVSTRDHQYVEGVSGRELTCVNRLSCSVITATLCQPNHCITTAMKEATKASEGTVLKKSGY